MPRKSRGSHRIVVAALVLSLAAPSASWAQGQGQPVDSVWKEGGIGFACALSSLLYSTVKVVYATAGTVTGLLAFALTGGRRDVLDTIINPSLRGDYVITREHLQGQRRLIFIGPYPEDLVQEEPLDGDPDERDDRRDDDETLPF